MPHPERAAEAILGSDDGMGIFRSLVDSAARRGHGAGPSWRGGRDDGRRARPSSRSIAGSA